MANDSMANNTTNSSFPVIDPPIPMTSDYVQIGVFLLILAVGLPVNIWSVYETYQLKTNGSMVRSGSQPNVGGSKRVKSPTTQQIFLKLKMHLLGADLMILLLYIAPYAGWLIVYNWLAGDFACKVYKFFQVFSLSCCSNLMAAMAAERALTVLFPTRNLGAYSRYCGAEATVKLLLGAAYTLTFAYSVPQLFVNTTIRVSISPSYTICGTIWVAAKIKSKSGKFETTPVESFYSNFHLLVMFWLPVFLITVAYAVVFQKLLRIKRQNLRRERSKNRRARLGTNQGLQAVEEKKLQEGNEQENVSQEKPADSEKVPLKQNSGKPATDKLSSGTNTLFMKTLLVVVVFVFLWLPYNIVNILTSFNLLTDEHSTAWQKYGGDVICFSLIALDAIVNPFLYRIN